MTLKKRWTHGAEKNAGSWPHEADDSQRRTDQDFARFLTIAEGSLSETDYLLLCATELGYVAPHDQQQVADEIDEISRMLYTFRRRVEGSK